MNWYLAGLKNYTDFFGRSSRIDFWMFALCHFVIMLGLQTLIGATITFKLPKVVLSVTFLVFLIYFLATIIPYLAILTRRLHDIGKSGWFMLIGFIPILGLIMIYFLCLPSDPETNQYGPAPQG